MHGVKLDLDTPWEMEGQKGRRPSGLDLLAALVKAKDEDCMSTEEISTSNSNESNSDQNYASDKESRPDIISSDESLMSASPNITVTIPVSRRRSSSGSKRRERLGSSSSIKKERPGSVGSSAGMVMKKSADSKLITATSVAHNLLVNYKPARGRARAKQLAKMTPEEIEAERQAKLERNRMCARECRRRKKSRDNEAQKLIEQLQLELEAKEKTIEDLRAQLAAQALISTQ